MPKRFLFLVYGAERYLIVPVAFLYAIAFVGGLTAPMSLHDDPQGSFAAARANRT